MGFNCLTNAAPLWDDGLLLVPRTSWYSLNRLWKGKRLCWSWSHLAVLNSGPLDLESSILTTSPSLLCSIAPLLHCSFAPIETFLLLGLKKNAQIVRLNYVLKDNFKLIVSWLSHLGQGDSRITCELDFMVLF